MSVMKKIIIILVLLLISGFIIYKTTNIRRLIHNFETGQKIDSLNGVYVYYNGNVGNVVKRNTKNGYNIGLEYQCVEFVKRYYYEYFNHKMPDSYGHAKSFFDKNVPDGKINKKRDLIQYKNPSYSKPQKNDLIVMDATKYNSYGHVVIVSQVFDNEIEIIQQNPGPNAPSRKNIKIKLTNDNKWLIDDDKILGWLRKE